MQIYVRRSGCIVENVSPLANGPSNQWMERAGNVDRHREMGSYTAILSFRPLADMESIEMWRIYDWGP